MREPAPDGDALPSLPRERGAVLALLPLVATLGYYALPPALQNRPLIQFAPQFLAYGAMGLWATWNSPVGPRLGLSGPGMRDGLRWGLMTGLFLGGVNTSVILLLVPSLGYDITFLTQTPHAQLPVFVMIPWFILGIAIFVEVNFRGFLLGRLAAMEAVWWESILLRRLTPLALVTSTLTFAFDPFMVATFRHLHWIAVWDGLIWGMIWLRTRNLAITIVAHAVEVIVMYLSVKAALG